MIKIVVGAICSLIAALIIAATGWNFKATAEISEKYVNKQELQCTLDDMNRRQERVENKVDRILELMIKD